MPGKLVALGLVLLLFLPSVAAVYRQRDGQREVLCRKAAQEDIMRGEDEPGKLRIFLIPGDRVDLNRATVRELALLPHVGDVTAERIAALRESLGGFEDIRQLLDVEGIGEESLADIAPYVFAGETK